MTGDASPPPAARATAGRRIGPVAPAVAGGALAAGAAFTTPFTLPADVVTAVGLAAMVAVVVVQRIRPDAPVVRRRSAAPGAGRRHWGPRWLVWTVPVGAAVAWELWSYLQAPRSAHPTLSSMLDTLDASHPGRAAVFAGWLLLGWYLVTR